MLPDSRTLDPRALESLLAFWRDAGVDACFQDEPVDRLHRPAPALALARAAGEAAAAPLHLSAPSIDDAVAQARLVAASATTLEALRAVITAFDGWGQNFAGARPPFFARGPDNATLMVIGEAPAAEDDLAGQPFTGPAGRLLDKMLAAAGLSETAFITNTVFWRAGASLNPSVGDCAVCAPFLQRAIDLLQPRAILLLGQSAARTVLKRDEAIMALRGRSMDHVSDADARAIPAIATLHPAFLLTQPQAKRLAWRDLLSLAARVDPVNQAPP